MTTSSRLRWRGGFALLTATTMLALVWLALGVVREAGADPTATASATKTVEINHFAFHPPTLHVSEGAKIKFANTSTVTHTATDKGSFNTGHIKAGTAVTVHLTQKGTFAYHCNIHPFMKGRIVVE